MKPINANEADYERFEILGHDALFTSLRIDRKTLPEGLHAYDLRDCDDCSGDPSELKNYVMVNHWGTVVVREAIEGADMGIELDRNDSTGCRTVSPKGGARCAANKAKQGITILARS